VPGVARGGVSSSQDTPLSPYLSMARVLGEDDEESEQQSDERVPSPRFLSLLTSTSGVMIRIGSQASGSNGGDGSTTNSRTEESGGGNATTSSGSVSSSATPPRFFCPHEQMQRVVAPDYLDATLAAASSEALRYRARVKGVPAPQDLVESHAWIPQPPPSFVRIAPPLSACIALPQHGVNESYSIEGTDPYDPQPMLSRNG